MPKVALEEYRLLFIFPAILRWKHVMLRHDKVAIDASQNNFCRAE